MAVTVILKNCAITAQLLFSKSVTESNVYKAILIKTRWGIKSVCWEYLLSGMLPAAQQAWQQSRSLVSKSSIQLNSVCTLREHGLQLLGV